MQTCLFPLWTARVYSTIVAVALLTDIDSALEPKSESVRAKFMPEVRSDWKDY